jgi:deazaflavin-dependent oxidoreductase (nitroreductase family)
VGSDLVIRGSHGGGPTDPHWVHNVRAHPEAWVRIRRKTRPMHAHVARGEERERIYEALCKRSRTTARYQEMCKPRELPLVVLREWDRVHP